jgi:hypothetical protein
VAPCCCVSVSWFRGFHVHSGCCHFSFVRMSRVRPNFGSRFAHRFVMLSANAHVFENL